MEDVPIYERYEKTKPRPWLRRTVERMVKSVPREHLIGLESIVLSESSFLTSKKLRVDGRTVPENKCLSFYHLATKDRKAWIELIVDNIGGEYPTWLRRAPLVRDLPLSKTLFHEIGHHIEARSLRGAPSTEPEAEKWEIALARPYFKRRYRFIAPLIRLVTSVWNRH